LNEKGDLEKIIEIESSLEEKDLYQKKVTPFFNKLGIYYEVFIEKDVRFLLKEIGLDTDFINSIVEKWVNTCIQNHPNLDQRGIRNPRFGMHCTQETKKLIGKRNRERQLIPGYKEKCKNSQAEFWKSEKGNLRKRELSEARKASKGKRNVIRFCENCGKDFLARPSSSKKCCCKDCVRSLNSKKNLGVSKNGYASMRTRLLLAIEKVLDFYKISFSIFIANHQEFVFSSKYVDKIVPLHLSLSVETLEKYKICTFYEKTGEANG
jgi:hypothetical protein